jgi:tRNA A-37 threonylcarbamoyl transferase component Bud32
VHYDFSKPQTQQIITLQNGSSRHHRPACKHHPNKMFCLGKSEHHTFRKSTIESEVGLDRGYKNVHLYKRKNIQHDVYKKSFRQLGSLLEPICPAIVNSMETPDVDYQYKLKKQILAHLVSRSVTTIGDKLLIEDLFRHPLLFLCMEYMNDYITLYDILQSNAYTPSQKTRFKDMACYELSRLHEIGYRHGDFHMNNVLIHPTYFYFADNSNSYFIGRAVLIDFGRSDRHVPAFPNRIEKIMAPHQWPNPEGERVMECYVLSSDQKRELERRFTEFDTRRQRMEKNLLYKLKNMGTTVEIVIEYLENQMY